MSKYPFFFSFQALDRVLEPSYNVEPAVSASLVCLSMSGRAWSMDTDPGNIQPMMLGACKFRKRKIVTSSTTNIFVSLTKVKIDLVIVFIFKDPFSSCLVWKKVVNAYFSSTKLTLLWSAPCQEFHAGTSRWALPLGFCDLPCLC